MTIYYHILCDHDHDQAFQRTSNVCTEHLTGNDFHSCNNSILWYLDLKTKSGSGLRKQSGYTI